MGDRVIVIVAWAADTAGVDHQPAVREADRPGNVRVAAENDRLLDASRERFDGTTCCLMDDALLRQGFEPVRFVACRRTMAKKERVAIDAHGRQCR
ncbi:hypothetical protein D3C87_1889780 [compost metagenome]